MFSAQSAISKNCLVNYQPSLIIISCMLSHRQRIVCMLTQACFAAGWLIFKTFYDGWVIGKSYSQEAESLAKIISCRLSHWQKYFPRAECSLKIISWELSHRKNYFLRAECLQKNNLVFLLLNDYQQIQNFFSKTHKKHTYGPKINHQELLILD
jgi:hypothetical protein